MIASFTVKQEGQCRQYDGNQNHDRRHSLEIHKGIAGRHDECCRCCHPHRKPANKWCQQRPKIDHAEKYNTEDNWSQISKVRYVRHGGVLNSFSEPNKRPPGLYVELPNCQSTPFSSLQWRLSFHGIPKGAPLIRRHIVVLQRGEIGKEEKKNDCGDNALRDKVTLPPLLPRREQGPLHYLSCFQNHSSRKNWK